MYRIADTSTGASQLRLFEDPLQPLARRQRILAALAMSEVAYLEAWVEVVVEEVRARFSANEGTAKKAAAEAARLFRYLLALEVKRWGDVTEALVLEWCWAARRDRSGHHRRTAQSTARNRQWTALELCKAAADLGAPINPVALIGERIARPTAYTSARPLTDHEDRLVCRRAESALAWSGLGVLVAAARSGGTPKEIAALRLGDVDLEAATVAFGGPEARVNPWMDGR